MEKLRKKGHDIKPVQIDGRTIARTFWGKAWCDHLDSFSDYENRLPRGRTYVRNGSVCHLEIKRGRINAMVGGSEIYKVELTVKTLARNKWEAVKKRCAGQIGSLLELLQGRLSKNLMSIVTDRGKGLFPLPGEISLACSCPDWAVMCKHVAAALYGVGARLDQEPDLLFLLRGVDQEELISAGVGVTAATETNGGRRRIADEALADVFGIEMSQEMTPDRTESLVRRNQTRGKGTGKRRVKTVTGESQVKKTPAERKVRAQKPSRATRRARPFTGKAVAALRAKFDLSQSQFARLLDVSAPTISNWEKKPGPLTLRPRSLKALDAAKRLTKRQARSKLDGSSRR
jgi:uncharacterized Zn finger protein